MEYLILEYSEDKSIDHKFKATKNSKFVFISGKRLNEPIVHYGEFVMNTIG